MKIFISIIGAGPDGLAAVELKKNKGGLHWYS